MRLRPTKFFIYAFLDLFDVGFEFLELSTVRTLALWESKH
jgi:hypothetical protein